MVANYECTLTNVVLYAWRDSGRRSMKKLKFMTRAECSAPVFS